MLPPLRFILGTYLGLQLLFQVGETSKNGNGMCPFGGAAASGTQDTSSTSVCDTMVGISIITHFAYLL